MIAIENAYPLSILPAGIKNTRGIATKRLRPKKVKVTRKPFTGLALVWRIKVINDIPSAPPTVLNIPRSPTMVATFSGSNSMQALFAAGSMMPIPIPVSSTRNDRISTMLNHMPIISHNRPGARRIVEKAARLNPTIMGRR
jgi:hypothetical protein